MNSMTPEDQARLAETINDMREQIDNSYPVISISQWAAIQIVRLLDARQSAAIDAALADPAPPGKTS